MSGYGFRFPYVVLAHKDFDRTRYAEHDSSLVHVPEGRVSSNLGAIFFVDGTVIIWLRNSKRCGW